MASLANIALPELNSTTTLLAIVPVISIALGASPTTRKWLLRKYYQYEVTMSVYMMNRNETIVFNLIFLSILLLFFWATFFYLPRHLFTIYPRLIYYIFGDESDSLHGMVKNGMEALWDASQSVFGDSSTLAETATTAVSEAVSEAVSQI
ncbi:hypothetical protein P152DRAFT_459861 [Eremomyces bilateralis CBS 781.70]|uniref:Uncharacterized protein n=1 Tax=Eremomyces bilateralis CBS 781.70 TaxID=1392243 RepID=A0A6G1FZ71_9PEZI|nr:uncharacterized protein P152DRAFT_459861 [Eremomyces bilateralis CBS 781.70]KAF1810991.1 hypothetical protein P152DRAFT_459861 [Eremomyces bilateralis CBS 781.70]